jgi:hypothetical protein
MRIVCCTTAVRVKKIDFRHTTGAYLPRRAARARVPRAAAAAPPSLLSLLLCARAPLCARIMMQQVKPDDPWWGSLQQPLKPAAAVADRGGKGSGGVGLLGSMANLANAAIGAGVLAFPSIYQKAGLKLGPVLTIMFALILGFTLHVISQVCADPSNVPCAQGDR